MKSQINLLSDQKQALTDVKIVLDSLMSMECPDINLKSAIEAIKNAEFEIDNYIDKLLGH